jgi:cyanophycinase
MVRTVRRRLAMAWMTALALGAPPAAAQGTLYIVGGGPQTPAMVQEFVDLAGGRGKARIVVMAMASAEGRTSGEEKAQQLRGLGATAVNLWIDRRQADQDSVVRLLDGATGIWFGGGLQTRLMGAIGGSRVADAIRARLAAGAVVGGTSAGAAVMSTPMITGDEKRRGGDRYPSDSSQIFITIDRGNVETVPGLGLLTSVVIDQHFVRRKRHNRLLSLVLEGPVRLGAGIDESTALVIGPDGRWRVSGASTVVVYDARNATPGPAGAPLGGSGIITHVLPPGSRFDPATGKATLPQ